MILKDTKGQRIVTFLKLGSEPNIPVMAYHPSYMSEVEGKLGKEVVKLMLDSARSGDISDPQLASIAEKLGRDLDGPNVIIGNHMRQMEHDRFAASDTLLKCILSDWWNTELYDLSPEAALSKLVQTCQDPDVALRPLAKKLQSMGAREDSPRQLPGEIEGEER